MQPELLCSLLELLERAHLDLPNSLAREVKLVRQLLPCALLGATEPEARRYGWEGLPPRSSSVRAARRC